MRSTILGALVTLAAVAVACSGEHRTEHAAGRSSASLDVAPIAPNCTADGWCWEQPTPFGMRPEASWGFASDDIWLVGAAGGSPSTVLHWDGTQWNDIPVPPFVSSVRLAGGVHIYDVWGDSPNDVWFGGVYGILLHWNGTALSYTPFPTTAGILKLWGSAANDVWAFGANRTAYRWNGASWASAPWPAEASNPKGVSGSGPNDVYMTADVNISLAGSIFRWNGAAWSRVPTGSTMPIWDVWGAAVDDVWAVGSLDTLVHFDGTTWKAVPTGTKGTTLNRVRGTASNDVWMTGTGGTTLHWDGTALTKVSNPLPTWTATLPSGAPYTYFASVETLWASAPDDTWMFGNGVLMHWNGTAFTSFSAGANPPLGSALRSVWGSSGSDVWATGSGAVMHYDGATWKRVIPPLPAAPAIATEAVWGSGPKDVWTVGQRGTASHYDGATWKSYSLGSKANFRALWGIGGNLSIRSSDIWAGGTYIFSTPDSPPVTLSHWNGTTWTPYLFPSLTQIFALWGSATDDVWAAAGNDSLIHWDGTAWTASPLPPKPAGTRLWTFRAIWGSATDDVYAAGSAVVHWDGTAWSVVPGAPSGGSLFGYAALWGGGADDVWLATNASSYHWDGVAWAQVATPTVSISSLWGNATDLWGVGEGGAILRRPLP